MDTQQPEKDVRDVVYTAIKAALASVPIAGGAATEFFALLITPPIEKRREQWFAEIARGFALLEKRVDQFETQRAFQDERFVSVFLQAYREAISNHNQENLRALRNAVLNSALPSAPDEIQQKMFVEWASQLTEWHLRILQLIHEERAHIPSLNLDDNEWRMNIALDDLTSFIEQKYPEMAGSYLLCVQVIGDLHGRGLILNIVPQKDRMSLLEHRPTLSSLAQEFVSFIQTPTPIQDLDKSEQQNL